MHKFLIVRLSSLGDIVHTLPVVNQLQQNHPDSQIDWLTGKESLRFLSLVDGINNIFLPTINDLIKIINNKYDYVIDVQGLFKSAFLSKISCGTRVVGFKGTREFADVFYDVKVNAGHLFKTNKHIVDLNLELITSLAENVSKNIRFLIPKIKSSFLSEHIEGVKNRKKIIVFPGTRWQSKQWSLNYWYELIESLSKNHKIFFCAATGDLSYLGDLISRLNMNNIDYVNLAGKTSFSDLIFLIQNSDFVIGMDSFGLHLAAAVKNDYGYPDIVGIYGPTNPARSGPYGQTENCLYLSKLECIGCRKKICPLKHNACMNNIVPEYVLEIVNSKIGTKPKIC